MASRHCSLADRIDGLVEGLDDVEAVQHQGGVRAVGLNGTDVGLTHVAAGGLDSGFLVVTHRLVEEPVDGLAALALADPDHAGALQVIDQRGVLVALVIRDLVNTNGLEPADAMTLAESADGSMQQVRQGRGRQSQQLSGSLLRHDLAVAQHQVFKAVTHPSAGFGPGQLLGDPSVGVTMDLTRPAHQPDRPGSDRDVTPETRLRPLPNNGPPPATVRTATTVLVRLDQHIEPVATAKSQSIAPETLELE